MIAPRLIAELTPLRSDSPTAPPPMGSAVWEDTHVTVGNVPSSPLKNLFTGQVSAFEDCSRSVGKLR